MIKQEWLIGLDPITSLHNQMQSYRETIYTGGLLQVGEVKVMFSLSKQPYLYTLFTCINKAHTKKKKKKEEEKISYVTVYYTKNRAHET